MRILITGGAGFIGSAVTRMAVKRGLSVVNADCLTYAANLQSLKDIENNQNYHFANIDCLLYTSPSPRDRTRSRMPSSA